MTHRIMTFSILTLSIKSLYVTLSVSETQHNIIITFSISDLQNNNTTIMLNVFMLSVVMLNVMVPSFQL